MDYRILAKAKEAVLLRAAQLEASLRESKGLGDGVAAVTQALGVPPCGGCKKRQELLNRKFPVAPPLAIPAGYRLSLQGQRDQGTQILLLQAERHWATFEYRDQQATEPRYAASEAEGRLDFEQRMAGK